MTRRHPLARCEDCSLNKEGTAFVPSFGPQDAKVVLVGEAPGFREAKTKKPFTGPSGQLLDAALQGQGIFRSQCLVTNALLCRDSMNSPATKNDIACCSERLESELKEFPRDAIITLGGPAATAVMKTEVKITSARVGPPKLSALYPDTKIIHTFHPAYIMRSADSFPQFLDDIRKINRDPSKEDWQPPTFRVFDESTDACAALRELQEIVGRSEGATLVLDIEAGIDKEDFGHPDQYQLLCVGIGYASKRVAVIGENALRDAGVRNLLRSLLTDPRARISAHNGKFDLAGLFPICGDIKLSFDTMLASYACDERSGTHGLKYLAVEKLGAPQYDLEIHKYISSANTNYANIPRDILYKYNAYDVSCTWDLQELYEVEMDDDARRVHDMLVSASDMLRILEQDGIRVDLDYLNKLNDDYIGSMDKLQQDLFKWVANPNSPKQVKEALNAMGHDVASTNVDALDSLLEKALKTGDRELEQFMRLMMNWRKEAKLYGTYIKGISSRLYNGRIFPTLLLHGTQTGRLACRNPNLQNVPRGNSIRDMYIPDEGLVFVQADYATIELRVVAALARDEVLADLLVPGRDIHSEIAASFFGDDFTKDQRVRAKAIVYGLAYGRTAYSIAAEYDWSVSEAVAYMDQFFGLIPATVAWREEIQRRILEEQDDLVTPFGRHRRFYLITQENREEVLKSGLAFLPQSTASDINLLAAIELQKKGFDVKLLVHDSILIQCKPEEVEERSKIMQTVMSNTARDRFTDFVPFPVDIKVGSNWGQV